MFTQIREMICTKKKRLNYAKQVKEYMTSNGIESFERLLEYTHSVKGLEAQRINRFLGNLPKAPWVSSDDILKQALCFLYEIGYEYAIIEDRKLIMDKYGVYVEKARGFFKENEVVIIRKLSQLTGKNGTITYARMKEVLPKDYPRAFKEYEELNIVYFWKQIDIPFAFDSRSLYFL